MNRLGSILGMLLAVVTSQATAETQMGGRDFNHMTTGFPLSGGHATAACETCHSGGVFKGTPKNCDGCHALGSRVVATPKSTSHIVTDAPCESCHFNTATFLGARFNHGNAQPGKCLLCHNGRQAAARPTSHSTGLKASGSCDSCHRTVAWVPASWNHIGVSPGSCASAGCHVIGSNQYYKPANHTRTGMATYACDDCHGMVSWVPARYKHTGASPSGICMGCHDGAIAVGKPAGHIATTDDCNQCHFSTATWLGALGAKPANHIPYNGGVQCTACHTGSGVMAGATLHANVSSLTCKTCHLSGTGYLGNMDKKGTGHEGWGGTGDCSQSGCHRPLGGRGVSYIDWD